jgi:hypothetical protein
MKLRSLAIFIAFAMSGCSSRSQPAVRTYEVANPSPVPDYNRLEYWAAHPWKKDPSDSIPTGISDRTTDSLVDVFFIHPTTYWGDKDEWNADVNNPRLNRKTDYSSILYQASVFNQHARVFAPRYRQVHLSAFHTDSNKVKPYFDTAYADIRTAFLYYLQHHNKDRPFIIAGHSQGALMSEFLLREFVDGKPLQARLVAAYIIGWPVMPGLFQKIKVCETPIETNCFCSWRTLRQGYVPTYMKKEKARAFVTNPISWTTDSIPATPAQNRGGVLRNFNEVVPATTGARINGGVLWVEKPRFPGSTFFWTKNYHIADVNLFYMSIRENVADRISSYLNKH